VQAEAQVWDGPQTRHWVASQVPQVSVPPQPSETVPQVAPCAAHVVGVQPHWPGVPPPPQVWGAGQVPQSTVPPQPSGAVPQVCPGGQLVAGVQQAPPTKTVPLGHGVQRLAAPGPLATQTRPAQQVRFPPQGWPAPRQLGLASATPRPASAASPPIIPLTTDRLE
jgi:hypothetical protein